MTFSRRQRGFTLLELLVVISIIGILVTLLITNFNTARGRARDAARKSDLRQLKTALRLYYNDYQTYPAAGTSGALIAGCGADGIDNCAAAFTAGSVTYMNHIPQDPLSPAHSYSYAPRGGGDGFTLISTLENLSDPDIADSQARCAAGSGNQYVVCED